MSVIREPNSLPVSMIYSNVNEQCVAELGPRLFFGVILYCNLRGKSSILLVYTCLLSKTENERIWGMRRLARHIITSSQSFPDVADKITCTQLCCGVTSCSQNLGLVFLIYLYSIHRAICRPKDRPVRRPRSEIRTRNGRI